MKFLANHNKDSESNGLIRVPNQNQTSGQSQQGKSINWTNQVSKQKHPQPVLRGKRSDESNWRMVSVFILIGCENRARFFRQQQTFEIQNLDNKKMMFDIKPKLLYESVPIFKLCNLYHGENSTRIGTVEPPVNLTPTNSTQILLSCPPTFLKEVTRSCQVHKNLSWPIITLTLITSLADYTLIFVGELRCRSL